MLVDFLVCRRTSKMTIYPVSPSSSVFRMSKTSNSSKVDVNYSFRTDRTLRSSYFCKTSTVKFLDSVKL